MVVLVLVVDVVVVVALAGCDSGSAPMRNIFWLSRTACCGLRVLVGAALTLVVLVASSPLRLLLVDWLADWLAAVDGRGELVFVRAGDTRIVND